MRRRLGVAALVVFLGLTALVLAGVTDAFGTGAQLRVALGGTMPDGAASSTFWDTPVIDIPGVTVTAIHCHGSVQYELQAGATSPSQANVCYAAMGAYTGDTSQWGVYLLLPGGAGVYRASDNYGPWRYCVARIPMYPSAAELTSAPASMPC